MCASRNINNTCQVSETSGKSYWLKMAELKDERTDCKHNISRVYVWDLDETLIIFQTLCNGRYAELFNGLKDLSHGEKLGQRWAKLILEVCDEYFFYEQIEDLNEPDLASWSKFDDGADLGDYDFCNDGLSQTLNDANKRKVAYRHRQIGNLYSKGLEQLIREEQLQEWQELYECTDTFTDGWLTAGRTLLQSCLKACHTPTLEVVDSTIQVDQQEQNINSATQASNQVNVLVTSGTLVPSLIKCLLFRLDKFFSCENVYSSWEVGKLQCFQWIKERFVDPGVQFCVIGDGQDECEAAQALSWPFIKIETGPGGYHRLPALSLPIIQHYVEAVYRDPENDA
eukprot:c28436_g1_i2 orf=322-1344(-)